MLVSKKTVYVGADIVTMSEKAPKAEAVCIADGRIECVGSREEVLGYAKAGEYDVVDFGGGTLYPGFIDTHSHMSSFSRCLNQVYCGASLGSIAAVQQALRDKAAASDDEWVIGYGYDDSGISDNRHMNRHDLDAVCADRPVMVVHISVHMGYVNTIGLERLGFTADTKVPGGERSSVSTGMAPPPSMAAGKRHHRSLGPLARSHGSSGARKPRPRHRRIQ